MGGGGVRVEGWCTEMTTVRHTHALRLVCATSQQLVSRQGVVGVHMVAIWLGGGVSGVQGHACTMSMDRCVEQDEGVKRKRTDVQVCRRAGVLLITVGRRSYWCGMWRPRSLQPAALHGEV